MTKINFYNGLREIGGTFVEIETEKAKCMFDFGFAVVDRMDSNIKLRKENCASDYVRLGMLTPADGIYDKKTAEKLGLKAYGETKQECFFVISHMHIDHMGGLGMLAPEIPVYMSEDSLRLYHAMDKDNDLGEMGAHPNCKGIAYHESFTIGDIKVTVLPIDHDVIGASGFLIETPDGNICYTGDYRFHGFHPEITQAFAEQVKGADVMITEGVTVSFSDIDMCSLEKPTLEEKAAEWTEEALQTQMAELAKSAQKLLIINPYIRNVERLHRLLHTFDEQGRTLVLEKQAADYVAAFYPEDKLYVYANTLEEQKTACSLIDRDEILAHPEKYVLQLDYSHSYELIDLCQSISMYVHMDGSPLGDYDPSFKKMHVMLEVLGIEYIYKGTGGHARPYYLRYMVDTIAPKTLIPLHSFRPEQVKSDKAGEQFLPEYGDTFVLEK